MAEIVKAAEDPKKKQARLRRFRSEQKKKAVEIQRPGRRFRTRPRRRDTSVGDAAAEEDDGAPRR